MSGTPIWDIKQGNTLATLWHIQFPDKQQWQWQIIPNPFNKYIMCLSMGHQKIQKWVDERGAQVAESPPSVVNIEGLMGTCSDGGWVNLKGTAFLKDSIHFFFLLFYVCRCNLIKMHEEAKRCGVWRQACLYNEMKLHYKNIISGKLKCASCGNT